METPAYYPDLSVGHVFGRSWRVFKDNMGFVFAVVVVCTLVVIVSAVIPFLPLIIIGPLQVGAYYVLVRLVRDEEVELRDMFDGFKEFGRSFGVYWVYSLAVGVGCILLIIPGIILAIGLLPCFYLVLDANYGVGDTLQEAWEMTKGYKWSLFVIMLALAGLIILGLFALIIGSIFASVFGYVVMATAYDELSLAGLPDETAE